MPDKGNEIEGVGVVVINARYPELPFTFGLTRVVERSLFYPQFESIRPMRSRTPSLFRDHEPAILRSRHHPEILYFLRKEQPSVRRALPPVGWHLRTALAPDSRPPGVWRVCLQDLRAALANDDGLCVREDGGDGEAAGALDVHEEGAGGGHQGLELVLAGLTAAG